MSAKDDCYRLIQQIAIKRAVFCQWPPCNSLAECGHHIFKRDRLATAFVPDCVIGLCTSCHNWVHSERPPEFESWVKLWMGGQRYYEFQRLSYAVVKNFDFKECRKALRKVLL